ncbi:MAG TPA: ADP-ribosylation factor-directed GTPase activating protein isoform b [Lacipirellulaceae bacterium]|nr:ADP-ribosylation factor-directed GTPase activating protein isoform b [Lacipirellulaceae bacterium]
MTGPSCRRRFAPLLAVGLLAGCGGPAADDLGPRAAQTSASPTVPKPQPPGDPALPELREQLREVLDFTEHGRIMSLEKHAAWQLLHGVLAFGPKFEILAGREKVVALDWVFDGKPMKGWTLTATPQGVRAEIEPGKLGQGHEDQWLAIISQWPVPVTRPLVVDGQQFRMRDMIKRTMFDCWEGKESSWTIIALSTHLDPIDQKWVARDGEEWTVERLVDMEAGPLYEDDVGQEMINQGACGGTHRLIGLSIALNNYRAARPREKLAGGWLGAQKRVEWAVAQARQNQLPSGAFSIHYFRRPMNSASIDEHLAATGHTLEFLSFALTKEQLEEKWVRRAVGYLCRLLERTKHIDLECGSLYHAAHGLVLYRNKVFGEPADSEARQPSAALR